MILDVDSICMTYVYILTEKSSDQRVKTMEWRQRNDDLKIKFFFYSRLTQQLWSHAIDGEFWTKKIIRQCSVSLLKKKYKLKGIINKNK